METKALRQVLVIGLSWALVWAVFWTIASTAIAMLDPDSIDPGEPVMMVAILGSMGVFSGIAFSLLLVFWGRGTPTELSVGRVAVRGLLSSAIVQVGYLNHGDLGLMANIKEALLLAALGGVVTMVWLAVARAWLRWRSSKRASA